MTKRVDFHKITTLADVRKERRRVDRALARRKEWLEEDVDRISEVLSVDYWASILSDRISGIASGWLGAGYGLIGSLLGRLVQPERRIRRRRCDEEEELLLIVEKDDE